MFWRKKASKEKDQIPIETNQILNEHGDKVLFCEFSPDGKRLATASKDATVSIYDVDPDTFTVRPSNMFSHPYEIGFLAWSPDSNLLVACGPCLYPDLWVWNVSEGILKLKLTPDKNDKVTSGCWSDDGKTIVSAGIKGQYYHFDLNGTLLNSLQDAEVKDLRCRNDGKTIYAADVFGRIRLIDFEKRNVGSFAQEFNAVISMTLNKQGDRILVHSKSHAAHLWDLETGNLNKMFNGITEQLYISALRSCFGGDKQQFFAGGSRDGNVYVWSIKHKRPLATLTGHTDVVRCVSWNPVYHQMLASVSDDCTVRIWVPAEAAKYRKKKGCQAIGSFFGYLYAAYFEHSSTPPTKGRWARLRDAVVNVCKGKSDRDTDDDECEEDNYAGSMLDAGRRPDDGAETSRVDPEGAVYYRNRVVWERMGDAAKRQSEQNVSAASDDEEDEDLTNVQSQETIDERIPGDGKSRCSHRFPYLVSIRVTRKRNNEKIKAKDIRTDHLQRFQKH